MAHAAVTLGGLELRVIKIVQRHQKYVSNPNGRDDEGEEHSDRSALPRETRHLRGPPGSPERRGP